MPLSKITKTLGASTQSIYAKCLWITTLVTLVVVAVLSYQSRQLSTGIGHESVRDLAVTAPSNTASRLCGAIRFNNADELNGQIDSLLSASEGQAIAAIIMSADGRVLAQNATEDDEVSQLQSFAENALEDAANEQEDLNIVEHV